MDITAAVCPFNESTTFFKIILSLHDNLRLFIQYKKILQITIIYTLIPGVSKFGSFMNPI